MTHTIPGADIDRIEFFDKRTGIAIQPNESDTYFVMIDIVWRDTCRTCESQCAVVGFDDFIERCPNIGWRVDSAAKVGANVTADIPAWQETAVVKWPSIPLNQLAPWAKLKEAEKEIRALRARLAAGAPAEMPRRAFDMFPDGEVYERAPAETPAESFHEKLARELRDGTAVFEKRAFGAPAETPKPMCVRVASMKESNGNVTWDVRLLKSADQALWDGFCVYTDTIQGRAEYEAASLRHFLGLGPEPDMLAYDTDAAQPAPAPSSTENTKAIEECPRYDIGCGRIESLWCDNCPERTKQPAPAPKGRSE